MGYNLHTIICHKVRMFPLGTWKFIIRDYLPAIWVLIVNKDMPSTHVYHWFYCKGHPRNQ